MNLAEIIPPVLMPTLLQASERLKFLGVQGKNELTKNKILQNSKVGKRAFMIATGPSLKLENLSVLAGEDCYSISNFFLHDQLQTVHPKFHFFAPYHEPLVLENYIAWLKQADETLPLSTEMVLCLRDKELIESNQLFNKRTKHYLQFSNTPYHKNKVDLTHPILSPITGPLMMLPVLIYMGYSKIYLLGCDHTVLRDYKQTIKHFYDSEKDPRVNASNVDAWHGIIDSHKYSLATFEQYDFYKNMIREMDQKIEIVNLSQDSWLDIFSNDSLKNILNK